MALGDVAATLPWPVFACDGQKRPVVATGFKAATRDRDAIMEQFSRPSAAMIGVPTGSPSGIVVIDVDIKNGAKGQDWLDENIDALPETRTHRTQSGGLHLVFIAPPGVEIRNSASRVAPGVDVRGEGGYIIAPPSPGYQIADHHDPAEMPRWLIRACLPPEEPRAAPAASTDRHERYVQSAIDGEIAAITRAGEGTRNDTLHKAAVKLGTLVGAGALSRGDAEVELTRAGQMTGLPSREVLATVKSGLDFGAANPRELPQTSARTSALPADEPPPDMDDGWWQSLERGLTEEPHHDADPLEDHDTPPELDNGGIIDPREWTAPAPLREWLVQDWIPIGYVTAIYGDGGLGKSLLAQQLLTSTACGLPWLGMECKGGPAFGMMCEDDPDELHRRQEAINQGYGLRMHHLENLRYSSRVGLDNLLMTFNDRNQGNLTPLFTELAKYLGQFRPRLVVIDTVADTFGGDEVKRAHARQFVQGVGGNMARAFGCALVFLAHPSAAGMATGSGTGGSTAWSNTFRSRIYMTQEKDAQDPDTRLLSRKKANYAPKDAEIKLRWQSGCFAPDGAPQAKQRAGLAQPDIEAIFAEIDRAWKAGDPWSAAPQTKKFGRYIPLWASIHLGCSEREAARAIEGWMAAGFIRAEVADARDKRFGLRVVKWMQS